jgi:hypothetical protein
MTVSSVPARVLGVVIMLIAIALMPLSHASFVDAVRSSKFTGMRVF